MNVKKGLGRGLDALLSTNASTVMNDYVGHAEGLQQIPIDLIKRNPGQPREYFDEDALADLANSISEQGVVQPIIVRPVEVDGPNRERNYEIVAGERRWRAAQKAGLHNIPALVREMDEQTTMAVALIENIQRENLNPLEEAKGFKRLVEDYSMTHEAVADTVGRSRAAVTNIIRLLELTPTVQSMVAEKKLSMGQARALLGLNGMSQNKAAKEVFDRSLNTRQTEMLVKRLKHETKPSQSSSNQKDADVTRLEQTLSQQLGARVAISHAANGRGKLSIHYASLDQLDGILQRIK